MKIHGIITNNTFYSNNVKIKLKNDTFDDGIYSIDMESDEYLKSIEVSTERDLDNFMKKFKKSMRYVYGLSFKGGIIPFKVMEWGKFPIPITNSLAMEWEVIKVLHIIPNNILFYINNVFNDYQNKLFEIKDAFEKNTDIINMKHVVPEMRILYGFHKIEKEMHELQLKQLKEAEYKKSFNGIVETIIFNSGGNLLKTNIIPRIGFELIWEYGGMKVSTIINDKLSIIEAGFCISGEDKLHTLTSVVDLFIKGKNLGRIHHTRLVGI